MVFHTKSRITNNERVSPCVGKVVARVIMLKIGAVKVAVEDFAFRSPVAEAHGAVVAWALWASL